MRLIVITNRAESLEYTWINNLSHLVDVEIVTGAAGSMTLDIIRLCPVDAVISYVQYPDNDKILDFLYQIKIKFPQVYILTLVNPNDFSSLADRLYQSVDDFIATPVNTAELAVRVGKSRINARQREALASTSRSNTSQRNVTINTDEIQSFLSDVPKGATIPDRIRKNGLGNTQPVPSVSKIQSARTEQASENASGQLQTNDEINLQADDYNTEQTEPETKSGSIWRKAGRLAANVLFGMMILIIVFLAFFLIKSKVTGSAPSILGHEIYMTLSGSMNPVFDTGSMVIVRTVDKSTLAAGDIITFGRESEVMTTHRIVDVLNENGLQFVTRGDANNIDDPSPVPAENVRGKVVTHIPRIGFVMAFIQTLPGLILTVLLPLVLIILFEVWQLYKRTRTNRNRRLETT